MGVPHLITHLRPYATTITLALDGTSTSTSPSSGTETSTPWIPRAILDGPSLAYHVYCAGLAPAGHGAHPLATASSHEQAGSLVIAWLDGLRRSGIEIDRIYFDGALPTAKQEVRRARLEACRNQWMAYRNTHAHLGLFPWPGGQDQDRDLSSVVAAHTRPGPITKRKSPPAPAFLVPAVLEAIAADARYGPITQVVPGEADAYCAGRARSQAGLILTSDSDLLVYDVGRESAVVFFTDISLHDQHQPRRDGSPSAGLTCRCYQTGEMASRLGLDEHFYGMASLAFELEQDSCVPFATLLHRAKSPKLPRESDPAFQSFLESYRAQDEGCPPRAFAGAGEGFNHAIHSRLRQLDPRVSELVWQYITQQEELQMYLPFLLDDPTRSSAWEAGAFIRALGYSILNLSLPTSSPVGKFIEEIGRRGQRIASTSIALMESNTIMHTSSGLVQTIQSLKATFPTLPHKTLWILFAIHEVISSSLSNDRTPPTISTIKKLLLPLSRYPNTPDAADWPAVHLLSQIQAVLYSLRMLRQFTEVGSVLVAQDPFTSSSPCISPALLAHLHTLTPLNHPLLSSPSSSAHDEVQWDQMLRHVFDTLDPEGDDDDDDDQDTILAQPTNNTTHRKKKKKKRGPRRAPTAPAEHPSRNSFAVLSCSG